MHAITHAFSQLALLHTLGILIPYPTFGIAKYCQCRGIAGMAGLVQQQV
jgi:hypothetical protein